MKEKDESKSQDSPPLTKQPDPSPSGNKNNILSAKPQGLPDPAKSPTDGVAPETGLLVPSVQVTDNDGDTRCVDDSGPPKGSSSSANGSPNPSVRDQDSDLEDGEAKRIGEGDPNHVDHDEIIFNHFTAKSFQQLVENEADVKRKAEEKRNRPTEGRLVDGELKFGDEDDEDEAANVRDLSLIEGSNLPEYLAEEFPKDKISVPLEEIDHYLWRNQKTFVVITRRFKQKYLHRFTATKSLFLLAPWNPLRKLALLISTNQIFDYFIIITILVNCIFLALDEDYFPWLTTAEYVFTGIYSCEMIIKVTARGFLLNKYTYLRDAWNWIDFIVIVSAFLTISLEETGSNSLGSLSSLRTFRVLRALKTVSIVPGLKVIISALLRSLRMLAEVVLLQLFCMMVFALFAVQVYVGVLRQKCVQNYPDPLSDVEFADYIKNSSNWYERAPFVYLICGNASGSGRCPDNYTCLQDIGENPNWGYTSFDNFGWAMLTSFQLITLDFWEDAYNKVIRASGPWNIIFFIVVVFFGSFYLVNMMLAVVNMSYEEEVNSNKREKERDKEKQKRKQDKKVAQIAARRDEASLADKHHKDLALSNTNHLQVMSAIKGSSVASNVSLKSVGNGQCTSVSSVGNGVLRNSNANLQEDSKRLRDEAKLVDTSSSKAGNKPKSSAAAASLASSSAIGGDGGGGGGAGAGSPVRGNKRNVSIKGTKDMAEALSGSESSIAKAASKETLGVPLKQELGGGYSNPALTLDQEDTLSLDSENNGDPPVVIVKDDDDEELVDRNCAGCSRVCKGYLGWLRCQNALYKVISDLIFEIFVTFCIILNVVFMAIEHHGMSDDLALALKVANYIFTTIFILEAAVKILAMSKHYFRSGWNIFDLIIVAASIIDMGLEDIDGLSVFRAFRLLRLLRVFKLAQTWSTMRMLLSIIMRTLGALGNLTFVLLIVSYIFAVIGMQLFSNSYTAAKFAPDPVPRWNFSDFFHSLMLIFRVLCGEWIEPLWDCMRVEGEICMVVFLPTLVLGNLMVLNLFLALLLNSFATDSLSRGNTSKDSSKMKQGWQRIKGLFKSSKVQPDDRRPSLANIILEVKRQKDEERRKSMQIDGVSQDEKTETSNSNGDIPKTSDVIDVTDSAPNGALSNTSNSKSVDQVLNTNRPKGSAFSNALRKVSMTASDGRRSDKDSIQQSQVEITDAKEDLQSGSEIRMKPAIVINDRRLDDDDDLDGQDEKLPGNIENCLWNCCYEKCCTCCQTFDDTRFGDKWRTFRVAVHKVTEHKAFEYFILIIIITSSVSLCFEDIYIDEQQTLKVTLSYLNIIFATLFSIEMVLKWIGLGFKKYFSSFWTILDFSIVIISLISLAADSLGLSQLSSFRALRTLRALRPLRAISRWQGMKIVVNALMSAFPSIVNVLLVCLVFWLIFSIAGVQLFGGKFFKCVDETGERINASIVPNKSVCLAMAANGSNYNWTNSKVNFDHIILGYLALLQVATFEGWMEVMADAIDSREVDEQPDREANLYAYIYFVIFIICGSFFTLNLFIGVIIDNFNMLKKRYEGGYLDMLLTPNQKNYYNTMKKLSNRKPQKTIKRPKNKVQGFFFDVAMSTKFELAIVILIFLNMIAMAVEHYHMAQSYKDALDVMNLIFTTIFSLEAIVKIVGMRWHYFRRPWNVFDFIIVALSIIGVVLDDLLRDVFVTPSLLRVVRIFRIGRVLRLIKVAKGVRKLLFALVISLPALFNIGMLLFMLVFIYAIFGMALFGNIKAAGMLDDVVNFQTFGSSMLLLFRLTTAGGWNDVLGPMMISEPHCNPDFMTMPDGRLREVAGGDCGTPGLAVAYMVSFIIITYLITINMYIAVILENFSQAHEQEEVGITEDDFEMFYVVWERFDPHATQFIKYEQLSDVVADLDAPLGIPKPNEIALVAFDLPIYEGERLHCLDILMSLVKYVLGTVEVTEEFKELKIQMEVKYREAFPTRVQQTICSTTMRRKKEDVAAKTLQRAWRKHKAQVSILRITEMAMQAKLNRGLSSMSNRRSSNASSTASLTSSASPKHGAPIPRPDSANSNKTIKASATAAEVRRKSMASKTLRVPSANEIKLPSDSDSNV